MDKKQYVEACRNYYLGETSLARENAFEIITDSNLADFLATAVDKALNKMSKVDLAIKLLELAREAAKAR